MCQVVIHWVPSRSIEPNLSTASTRDSPEGVTCRWELKVTHKYLLGKGDLITAGMGNGQRAWDYRRNSLQEPVGDVTN